MGTRAIYKFEDGDEVYTIRDKSNGSLYPRMRLDDILEEINRDRSEGWMDYDATDWREGLEQFTEWEVIENGKDDFI